MTRMRRNVQLLVALTAALAYARAGLAATLTVGADKTYQTPAAALAAASDGDVILIDDGTYVLTTELQVEKGVTFKSASGDRAACVISGGDAVPVVYIPNSVGKTIVFDSLTLTHGAGAANRAAGLTILENRQKDMHLVLTNIVVCNCSNGVSAYGGGAWLRVQNATSDIKVIDSEFHHNAQTTAGIYGTSAGLGIPYSYATVMRCSIHDNVVTASGTSGAGLRMNGSISAVVTETVIYDNVSSSSGAGICVNGNTLVKNCIISNNTSTASGGGVYCATDGGTYENCVICRNKGSTGGGVQGSDGATYVFRDCTICDNEATSGAGGGINPRYIAGTGPVLIERCQVLRNKAKTYGGGLYHNESWSRKSVIVRNCLFRDNTAANSGGGAYIDIDADPTQDGSATGIIWCTNAFESCTFVGNCSPTAAGLLCKIGNNITLADRFHATDCVFFGNTNATGVVKEFSLADVFKPLFSTCASDETDVLPEGNVAVAASDFTDVATGNYTPVFEGALYDAATTRSWMTDDATDLLGNRRISTFGTPKKPDIGAIEWQAHSKFAECAAAGHPHKEVTPGSPATCEEQGWTEGIWCPDCESVLSARNPIPALGHLLGPVEFVWYAPSAVTPGLQVSHCLRPGCGKEVKESLPALGFDYARTGTPAVLAKEAALHDEAGVVYVAQGGVDASGRGAKATPFATVAGALAYTSVNPLEIRVLHGVYAQSAATAISGRRVTVRGAAGDRDCVVIDAQNACVGVDIQSSAVVTLKDLSVVRAKNSSTSGVQGGAVNAHSSSVLITNCTLAASTGTRGAGGVGFENCSSAQLVDSQIVACTNLFGGSWCYGGGVYFKDNTAMTMRGNRVALCYSADGGGGASSQHGSFTNCAFYGNVARNSGGGVYLFHMMTGIADCRFEANSAETQNGGGLYVDTEGAGHVVESCTLVGNAAWKIGGGICFNCANSKSVNPDGMAVRNCTVRGNAANGTGSGTGMGGGICLNRVRGGLYENLTIEGNEAEYGGGLYICHDQWGLDARRIEVRQCRVAANRARANGAGVYADAVTTNWLVNACTIVANTNVTANKEGAGFCFASVYNAGSHGSLALRNTVIATNVAAGATASRTDFAAAASATAVAGWDDCITYSAVPQADAQLPSDAAHHNVLGGNFRFENPKAGDYRPRCRSALVGAGLTEDWMIGRGSLDLSGARRLSSDGIVDIGAYEYQRRGLFIIVR